MNTNCNHTLATHTPLNAVKEYNDGPIQYVSKGIHIGYGTACSTLHAQATEQMEACWRQYSSGELPSMISTA